MRHADDVVKTFTGLNINTGLALIHYKYFIRNLTLHHFLLSKNGNSDVITKTHHELASLEYSSTHKNLVHQDSSTNKNMVHTKNPEEEEYSSASQMSPHECHCTFKGTQSPVKMFFLLSLLEKSVLNKSCRACTEKLFLFVFFFVSLIFLGLWSKNMFFG